MSHRMHSPLLVVGDGVINFTGAVRLPPGERFQVVHFAAGTIRYRYGALVSPALYAAVVGVGPILVHPGTEVFIELSQAIGTQAFFHVIGMIPSHADESGWER